MSGPTSDLVIAYRAASRALADHAAASFDTADGDLAPVSMRSRHLEALLESVDLPESAKHPERLPKEPGRYVTNDDQLWTHQVYAGLGDHPDVDQWLDHTGLDGYPPLPLHRLGRSLTQVDVIEAANATNLAENDPDALPSWAWVDAFAVKLAERLAP